MCNCEVQQCVYVVVVQASSNNPMIRLTGTISGRITWLFYLTSGLPADEAFHDHVPPPPARLADAAADPMIVSSSQPMSITTAAQESGVPGRPVGSPRTAEFTPHALHINAP